MADDTQAITARGSVVDGLIRSGKGSAALLKALENPPFTAKSQATKVDVSSSPRKLSLFYPLRYCYV